LFGECGEGEGQRGREGEFQADSPLSAEPHLRARSHDPEVTA